jgi:hypothetical protein
MKSGRLSLLLLAVVLVLTGAGLYRGLALRKRPLSFPLDPSHDNDPERAHHSTR